MRFWDYILHRKGEIVSHGRSLWLFRTGPYVLAIVKEPEEVQYENKILVFESDETKD